VLGARQLRLLTRSRVLRDLKHASDRAPAQQQPVRGCLDPHSAPSFQPLQVPVGLELSIRPVQYSVPVSIFAGAFVSSCRDLQSRCGTM
jgi:uncharacterized lipoprotein